MDHQARLKVDPAFNPEFSQIMDLSEVERIDLTAADIRWLAKTSLFAPTACRAIVTKNAVGYGLARMFEMLRELSGERGIHVVRSRAEADAWIREHGFAAKQVAQAGNPI